MIKEPVRMSRSREYHFVRAQPDTLPVPDEPKERPFIRRQSKLHIVIVRVNIIRPVCSLVFGKQHSNIAAHGIVC
jgi:hypothetical protein